MSQNCEDIYKNMLYFLFEYHCILSVGEKTASKWCGHSLSNQVLRVTACFCVHGQQNCRGTLLCRCQNTAVILWSCVRGTHNQRETCSRDGPDICNNFLAFLRKKLLHIFFVQNSLFRIESFCASREKTEHRFDCCKGLEDAVGQKVMAQWDKFFSEQPNYY